MRGYCSHTRTSKHIDAVQYDQTEHNYNVTLASVVVAWLNTHEEAHVGSLLISIPARRQAHAHAPRNSVIITYRTLLGTVLYYQDISPRSRWLWWLRIL